MATDDKLGIGRSPRSMSWGRTSQCSAPRLRTVALSSSFLRRFLVFLSSLLLVFIAPPAVPSVSAAGASAPDLGEALERSRYGTLPPTVFAPTGKLHMVERAAAEASDDADLSGSTIVALRCGTDGGEFVAAAFARPRSPHAYYGETEKEDDDQGLDIKVPDEEEGEVGERYRSPLLIEDCDPDERRVITEHLPPLPPPPPVSILSPSLVVSAAGGSAASSILLRRLQDAAFGIHRSNDVGVSSPIGGFRGVGGLRSVTASDLARRVADTAQIPTQTVGSSSSRMLSSTALILGTDGSHCQGTATRQRTGHSCRIWRVDPTGQFWDCDAAAAGRGAGSAEAALLRMVFRWKKGDGNGEKSEEEKENSADSKRVAAVTDRDTDSTRGCALDEEIPIDKILQTVTNEDVRAFLSTLSHDGALDVAFQCLARARKMKETDYMHQGGATLDTRYVGVQGLMLHAASVGVDKSEGTGTHVEVLPWKILRRRLDLFPGSRVQ